MALGTLANLEVYDGSWKFANGSAKGLSVYDGGSWKTVRECFVYDGGSWKWVWPIRANTCSITASSNGSCPSSNSWYRITMTGIGPFPQGIVSTPGFFTWSYYRRQSTVSQIHLLGLSWQFQGSTTMLSSGLTASSINLFNGVILGGDTTDLWTQFQGRLGHSTQGQMTAAQGGHATSIVRLGKTLECGGPK